MTADQLNTLYAKWCKNTGRNGGVIIGKSVKEFFQFVEEHSKAQSDIDFTTKQVPALGTDMPKTNSEA